MNKILTETSTISTKYQTVIPARIRKALDLRESGELVWQIIEGERPMIMVAPKPKRWSQYLSGLGKRVWKGVDTSAYLKDLKREWQLKHKGSFFEGAPLEFHIPFG